VLETGVKKLVSSNLEVGKTIFISWSMAKGISVYIKCCVQESRNPIWGSLVE